MYANAFAHYAINNSKLTQVLGERDGDMFVREYKCDLTIACDGSSIWGDTNGRKVHVTGVTVIEWMGDEYLTVNVQHNSTWDIYTDKGFEQAISDLLGFAVTFTEQGMQEDNYASMEG